MLQWATAIGAPSSGKDLTTHPAVGGGDEVVTRHAQCLAVLGGDFDEGVLVLLIGMVQGNGVSPHVALQLTCQPKGSRGQTI